MVYFMKIVIATIKSWNIAYARELQEQLEDEHEILVIESKEELEKCLRSGSLQVFQPDFIFFPHWSYMIPKEIYEAYSCVVFHMTDLPFGRGGSPLQNLIVRDMEKTRISAIQVVEKLDEGPVYLKSDLSLEGSAEEIYKRAAKIIFQEMIPVFLKSSLQPIEQEGEVVNFKRRKPADGELLEDFTIKQIYDYIRMLDAEDYPHAFLMLGDKKLTFTKAVHKDGKITAAVEIEELEERE